MKNTSAGELRALNARRSQTDQPRSGYPDDMVGDGGFNGDGPESGPMFEGGAAIGYDHGYDAEVFYLGLALDPAYIEGFVEGCLERIDEDDPDGEDLLRGKWEKGDKEMALEVLQAECEVRAGRPMGF